LFVACKRIAFRAELPGKFSIAAPQPTHFSWVGPPRSTGKTIAANFKVGIVLILMEVSTMLAMDNALPINNAIERFPA
jgi:hypothetical protein